MNCFPQGEKNKELEKQVASLKEKMVSGKANGSSLEDDVQKIGDVSLLVKKLEGVDAKTLRTFIDNAKNQLKSVVVVAQAVSTFSMPRCISATDSA